MPNPLRSVLPLNASPTKGAAPILARWPPALVRLPGTRPALCNGSPLFLPIICHPFIDLSSYMQHEPPTQRAAAGSGFKRPPTAYLPTRPAAIQSYQELPGRKPGQCKTFAQRRKMIGSGTRHRERRPRRRRRAAAHARARMRATKLAARRGTLRGRGRGPPPPLYSARRAGRGRTQRRATLNGWLDVRRECRRGGVLNRGGKRGGEGAPGANARAGAWCQSARAAAASNSGAVLRMGRAAHAGPAGAASV